MINTVWIGLTLNKLRNSSSGLEYKLQFYVLNETTLQLTFVINLFESEAAPTLSAELTKHLTAPNIERLFIYSAQLRFSSVQRLCVGVTHLIIMNYSNYYCSLVIVLPRQSRITYFVKSKTIHIIDCSCSVIV